MSFVFCPVPREDDHQGCPRCDGKRYVEGRVKPIGRATPAPKGSWEPTKRQAVLPSAAVARSGRKAITVRHRSHCRGCRQVIREGERALWKHGEGVAHPGCAA